MGGGVVECNFAVTRNRKLVCSSDQCYLHTTTNILVTPLAARCTAPFHPA